MVDVSSMQYLSVTCGRACRWFSLRCSGYTHQQNWPWKLKVALSIITLTLSRSFPLVSVLFIWLIITYICIYILNVILSVIQIVAFVLELYIAFNSVVVFKFRELKKEEMLCCCYVSIIQIKQKMSFNGFRNC